ncbi:MAG: hypothetical protein HWN81_00250 [Candidatus Lokiarchaeota archaeon]|nr:hypothetical protein [Candidatus Lokiarchaeota archaeon]
MNKIVILFLLISSCGFQKIDKKVPPPPPELVEYIEEFERYYSVKIDYSVDFEDLTYPAVGVCRIYGFGLPEVRIDRSFFEEYKDDYYTIHNVLWHEFGHCSFRLGHDNATLPLIGYPTSIMYPYVFGMSDYYADNIDYYEEELDHRRKNSIMEFEADSECTIKYHIPIKPTRVTPDKTKYNRKKKHEGKDNE